MTLFRRRPRCVVYTVLFGYSEPFGDFRYERDDIDFVCFTDDPELRSDFWRVVYMPPGLLDPPRAAKTIKHLPHRYLPQHDWSLYIDNTIRLKMRPRDIFARFLAESETPLVCFSHPKRDCVYDEARTVVKLGFDDPARVQRQADAYRSRGYPAHRGLFASGFLLRRHHDPFLVSVMEQWNQQTLTHSYRDQISLPVACWHGNFNPTLIDQKLRDNEIMLRSAKMWRVPRDFDDTRYLAINPDIAVAGLNPRKHFLLHGEQEARRYK